MRTTGVASSPSSCSTDSVLEQAAGEGPLARRSGAADAAAVGTPRRRDGGGERRRWAAAVDVVRRGRGVVRL